MISRDDFIAGIQARAKVLREAGVLGQPSMRRTRVARPGVRQGRPPKPRDLASGVNLIDAFDEIEPPLEEESSDL